MIYEDGKSYLVTGSLLNKTHLQLRKQKPLKGAGIETEETENGTIIKSASSSGIGNLGFHSTISGTTVSVAAGAVFNKLTGEWYQIAASEWEGNAAGDVVCLVAYISNMVVTEVSVTVGSPWAYFPNACVLDADNNQIEAWRLLAYLQTGASGLELVYQDSGVRTLGLDVTSGRIGYAFN
ncbi:MAG: hypothetical protein QM680_13390 [Luteolibacter sp.]